MIPVAPEISAKYVLTTPSGFRCVFNDPNDPDHVGGLTDHSGFDSPEIREETENRPMSDGGLHGTFLMGRRAMTLTGKVVNQATVAGRTATLSKLQSAVLDCLRSNGTLAWTLSSGQQLYCNVRTQQPLRVTGTWVKEFQIALVASDPRMYAVEQAFVGQMAASNAGVGSSIDGDSITALGRYGTTGMLFESILPLSFSSSRPYAGGTTYDYVYYSMLATNEGNTETHPTVSLVGPLGTSDTPIVIRNASTGAALSIYAELNQADTLVIDFANKQVSQNGLNAYSKVDPLYTEWWGLAPGGNQLLVEAASVNIAAVLNAPSASSQVTWQHAWV